MNKKIYKVTQTQLSSLQSNGFITVDGVRYDYDPNSLYILADPFAPEYRLETQGHNLHLLKDNVIISDLTVPFAQASVYASNAKNLQNKTGSKAYTYYDILPRVDYKDFLSIKDLPMEGILCGISRNGYFYKVREEGTNTDIPFTLFCQTVDGYYSLSTSEITTPIEGYTIKDYFNEAKFIPYGSIKTVNNTEPDANGNVQLNIPTVNNGKLTIQKNGNNIATFTANQSGNITANITVPTKFGDLTSRGEEYLEWGGPAKVGDISPVGMAISSEHNANRIAFINPNALKFEYSSDGGSTWTDYPITGDGRNTKTRFCTLTQVYFIGRPDASTNLIANKSKTRITITGQDGTNLYLYTALKKMLIEVSTPTTLSMLIEKRTGTNYESNGPWETVGTYSLDGWSGWNDIPLDFNLGGGSNQKSNYWQMRLTITCTTVNSNYPKEGALRGLRLFGSTNWSLPSALASTGHIYSYDMDERVEFPSDVYASKFIENGQALSNKYLGKTAQAADSAKLNGQPSSHYLTSIKMNGTTKTSTNSTIDLGTVITDITDLVPYTGATKDIDIGTHSFTMSSIFTVGSESSVYTQATPGSISLKNPIGTLSIGTYSLSVNGTTIYWPTVSADPNGKYFALKSDIPANIKDGTGNGSLNQIKDGTGTTFSIDDSSGNSKNPNAYALDNTIKGDIVFGGVGDYSTSLGGKSSAQGKRSVAQGTTTIAKGNYSHAEGDNSVALGPDSHAEGYATVTYGKASHSEGTSTQAIGEGSHAEGSNTKATKTGAHSEGEETDASGYASHTEGLFNKVLSEVPADTGGSGSGITPPPSTGWNIEEHRGDAGHAEGYGNVVYGFASHAEGHQNKSSGHYSHSEGLLNTASGNYSHAEGTGCLASGTGAHAGGSYCYAIASNAFAHGQSLTTNIPNQAVFGEYNLDLPFSSRETQYLFAIGNGTDVNHRSNAFVSYKDGRAAIGKDPVNDFDVATKGYVDRGYVKKLGSTGEYKVYMSTPAGKDASRTIATAPIGSSVPIRTKEGHILLPDASVSMPAPNEAISAGVADDLYGLDRKTKDFHPTTTLRWLNNNDQREMVINGSWVGFYSGGNQLLILRGDTFTYLDKVVKWNDLADLVENGTVLLNGDTGSIGSYTSVGNGVSSALNFAGQNISNTAKGVNSLSLGRLNSVEGAACFAYGNKNIIKGVASIAFGGGNTAGEKIDWTSLDAATNSSSSYCFAIGENNTSIGRTSITIGTANNSKGDGSISIGRDNTIWSKESVAIGRSNTLNRVSTGSYDEQEPDQGNGIVAIGTGLKTPLRYKEVDYSNNLYWNCVISGRYNDPYAYNCVRSSDLVYASSLPPLFTLGNGLSDTSRNNAIVLFHNASAINSDFIYFNEYSIFNKKCEFRGSETIIEGTLKDASGTQYIKGGTITSSFINSLF